MLKFKPERGCKKCGNMGRRLIADGKEVVFRSAAATKYVEKNEALLRTCKRCGFQWLEACVDNEEI